MRIECKIKRQGGSRVTLGDREYHFAPDDQGRHVAEVEDAAHVERLLSIPVYASLDGEPEKPADDGAGSGETLTPAGDEDGEGSKDDEEAELETARQAYLETFGKKAHHAMHADTIYERIEKGEA